MFSKLSLLVTSSFKPYLSLTLTLSLALVAIGPLEAQNEKPDDRPEERVILPDRSVPSRTTNQASAPPLDPNEACGSDVISGFELPKIDRPYQPETVTFSLQVKDELIPYRLMTVLVQPEEVLEIEAVFSNRGSRFTACTSGGDV